MIGFMSEKRAPPPHFLSYEIWILHSKQEAQCNPTHIKMMLKCSREIKLQSQVTALQLSSKVTAPLEQGFKIEVGDICLLIWSLCVLGKLDWEGFKSQERHRTNDRHFPLTLIIEFLLWKWLISNCSLFIYFFLLEN